MAIKNVIAQGMGFNGGPWWLTTLGFGTLDGDAFNGVIEVQLSNLSGDSGEECGVCFRKTDSSNFLTAYVDDGDNLVHLSKFEAGAETSIATAAWTAADTAELRVICQGSRIRVWVDRKLVIDATDSTFQDQVNAGLFSRSTTAVLFGAFYAQAI